MMFQKGFKEITAEVSMVIQDYLRGITGIVLACLKFFKIWGLLNNIQKTFKKGSRVFQTFKHDENFRNVVRKFQRKLREVLWVCTVILASNPTAMLRLCYVVLFKLRL